MIFKYGLPAPFEIKLVDTRLPAKRKIFTFSGINVPEIKRNIRIVFCLLKTLIFFRPHIVHLCCGLSPQGIARDYMCAVLSKISRARLVTQYHGNICDFPSTALKGLSYKFLTCLVRMSDVNLSLNLPSLQFINKIVDDTHRNCNYLLPNFIDDSAFDGKVQNKTPEKNKKKLRAVYVGGITDQKGVNDIVEIAPEFKDIEFVLIGVILDDFLPAVDNLPDNVIVLPQTTNTNILKELKKSDFFIFLSHSEGFPNAILEAMVSELPIVATNVGAIPEIVDDGKGGYICPPRDIGKIKETIYKLKNHDDLKSLGVYNFNKAKKHYAYSVVVDKLSKIYMGSTIN